MSPLPLFPFAFSIYLCVTLWAQRTGGGPRGADRLGDLGGSLLVLWALIALGWLAARRHSPHVVRQALAGLLFGLWAALFFSWRVITESVIPSEELSALVWTVLVIGSAVLVLRGRDPFHGLGRALNIAGIVLLVFALPALRGPAPQAPAQSIRPDARASAFPSIYLIILDKYTSGAWLAEEYGLDLTPFEDSLRALGFAVPDLVRANYAHTKIALTSMLESSYPVLPGDSAPSRSRYEAFSARLREAPVFSEFVNRGYSVYAVPTTFTGTREFAGVNVMTPPARVERRFAETVYLNSPLALARAIYCGERRCLRTKTTPYPIEDLEVVEWKLNAFSTLPDSAGPVFAVLHLLIPHEPYLYNEDCSTREPWWPRSDQLESMRPALRTAYAHQVRCLNATLLPMLRTLIERSQIPPVIVLQGDHGHGLMSIDMLMGVTQTIDQLTPGQLADRMTVFGAYRFPGADTLTYSGMTPINVLPMIRHSVFGEPYRRQPDRSYWSAYQTALEVTEVSLEQLLPPSRRP